MVMNGCNGVKIMTVNTCNGVRTMTMNRCNSVRSMGMFTTGVHSLAVVSIKSLLFPTKAYEEENCLLLRGSEYEAYRTPFYPI